MKQIGRLAGVVQAAVLCLVGLSAQAQAQEATISNGIRMGEGRLHPYFDVESRFDSAALLSPSGTELTPEMIAHFRPGLRLNVPSSVVELNLDANVDYVWYTGLLASGSSTASRLEAGADLSAAFNKTGAVEFDIADRFARSDRTTNQAVGAAVLSLFNEARVGMPIHPGGGALEVTPEAAFAVEFFEPLTPGSITNAAAEQFNYQNWHVGLDGRWKFLPKTAIILDSGFDFRSFASGTGNANLLRVNAGIAGLVSPKVSLLAKVGWGHDFAATSGARTVIGHLELSYLISALSTVKVGYMRSLEPTGQYGIYGDDRGYLDARFGFGEKLRLHGYAAFDYLSFYGNSGRSDSNITLDLGPEYQFTPWLSGAVGYGLGFRNSTQAGATLNFARHEAFARLSLTY